MQADRELSFGEVAVSKGFVTRRQLDDSIEALKLARFADPKTKLGALMVEKGYLTARQVEEVLKFQGTARVKIAGYEILEKVGQGGMGAVFKARQLSLDRIVAIKVLSPKLAADKSFCERFIKEARAVAKLSHPNIIVGIDVGKEGKYYYFAMEFVNGRSAMDYLKERGVYTEREVLQIARQIALALEHADKHNLVHRDIKPDNIMIDERNDAKLCDLGLAKIMDRKGGSMNTGQAVGTPHYIAPEQARGEENIRISSDFYAFGATLYHLTTGHTLFTGTTSLEIMTKHLNSEAPYARAINPKLSEAFCQLLEKMLAKEAKHRHQTPQELVEDLDRVIAGLSIAKPLAAGQRSSMGAVKKGALVPGRVQLEASNPRSTILRRPVERAEWTGGPKAPVASLGTFIVTGMVAVFLLLIGLQLLGTGSSGKSVTSSSTTGDTHNSESSAPEIKIVKAQIPAELPIWMPLEDARKFSQENPERFIAIMKEYAAAKAGAPAPILNAIDADLKKLELEQDKLFDRLVQERFASATAKLEKLELNEAFDALSESGFPEQLLTERIKEKLKLARSKFEIELMGLFHTKVRPLLEAEIAAADKDTKLLTNLSERMYKLAQETRIKTIAEWMKNTGLRLSNSIKTIELEKTEKALEAYEAALLQAQKAGQQYDFASARTAIQKVADHSFLPADQQKLLALFREDLSELEKLYTRAERFLESKLGHAQAVFYTNKDGQHRATVKEVTDRSNAESKALMLMPLPDAESIPLSRISAKDIAAYASVRQTDGPEARLKVAKLHFWHGEFATAYEHFAQSKAEEDIAIYRKWIESLAAKQLNRLLAEHKRQLSNKKSSTAERDQYFKLLSEKLTSLEAEFGLTLLQKVMPEPLNGLRQYLEVETAKRAPTGETAVTALKTSAAKADEKSTLIEKADTLIAVKKIRQDPPDVQKYLSAFNRVAMAEYQEVIKRKDRLDERFLLEYKFKKYDQALRCLMEMLAEKRLFEWKRNTGWVHGNIWQTGILMPNASVNKLKEWFEGYKNFIERNKSNSELSGDAYYYVEREAARLKENEAYFFDAEGLTKRLVELMEQGRSDSAALWTLCQMYNEQRPYIPTDHLRVLVLLREWYPEYEACRNGTVQWQLANVLQRDLKLLKEAAEEAKLLIERFPDMRFVKSGDALWFYAENREQEGRSLLGYKQPIEPGVSILKDALASFRRFQTEYPQNGRNMKDPETRKSTAMNAIDRVSREIGKLTGE